MPSWQDLWACEAQGKTLICGRSFLDLVIEYGQIPWLQSIYARIILLPCYRVNAQGYDQAGANLLHWAVATAQSPPIISALIEAGCDLSALAKNKNNVLFSDETRTPLYIACELGYAEQVTELFKAADLLDVNQTQMINLETALIIACKLGHESVVTLLLSHPNIDVNQPDRNGYTPLIAATRNNQKNCVKLLLNDHRTEVNAATRDKETAIYKACQNGNTEIINILLAMQLIDVNSRSNYQHETPLIRAVLDHHLQAIELLLNDERTQPNLANTHNETAFVLACKNARADIVEIMLCHGEKIDFNHVSNYGTGLRWACISDNTDNIVELLVNQPELVNINQVDEKGDSAFHNSCDQSKLHAVSILLTRADLAINLQNHRGETALWSACSLNRCVERQPGNEVLAVILKMRPDIDTHLADHNGVSPLLNACNSRYPEAVELLLSHREIDVNQADNDGITPLISLCQYTNFDKRSDRDRALESLLKCEKLNVNKTNLNGQTALHVACDSRDINTVRALLAHPDIRTDIPDKNGKTALQISAEANSIEILAALESMGNRPRL